MGCRHTPQEPGSLINHDMPQTSKFQGYHAKKETFLSKAEQAASSSYAISGGPETLDPRLIGRSCVRTQCDGEGVDAQLFRKSWCQTHRELKLSAGESQNSV